MKLSTDTTFWTPDSFSRRHITGDVGLAALKGRVSCVLFTNSNITGPKPRGVA